MARRKKITQVVEWGNEEHIIPVVSRGGKQINDKDRIKICELICVIYSSGEYTLKSTCEMCGISYRTFNDWSLSNEHIASIYNIAVKKAKVQYKELVRQETKNTVLRIIKGEYTRQVTKKEHVIEMINQKPQEIGRKVTTTEQWLKPSTTLLMNMLELTEPDNFSKAIMIEDRLNGASSDDLSTLLESLIIDDSEGEENALPPIKTEEAAREYGLKLKRPK